MTEIILGSKSYVCFWGASGTRWEGSKDAPERAPGLAFGVNIGSKIHAHF